MKTVVMLALPKLRLKLPNNYDSSLLSLLIEILKPTLFYSIIVYMTKARIVSNPKILDGKPTIAETRISVELIMNFLGAGMSIKEITAEYPELKKSEVIAAIEYATNLVTKTNHHLIKNPETLVTTLHEITR